MERNELEKKVRQEMEKLDQLYSDNKIDMSEYIRRKQDLRQSLKPKDS